MIIYVSVDSNSYIRGRNYARKYKAPSIQTQTTTQKVLCEDDVLFGYLLK